VTTHAPLRSRCTKAKSVCHVQGLGDGDFPTSLLKDTRLWSDHQLVAEAMGAPEGVLRFDETGLGKKGKASVGGARLYCGPLGQVENWQVGALAGYASRHGSALVAKRLLLPAVWWTEASAARRARGQVPPEVPLPSQPKLAATMWQASGRGGLLPFRYVVADCFLWPRKLRLGEKNSCADGVAVAEIIGRRLALAY
jgi:hypothetical protein